MDWLQWAIPVIAVVVWIISSLVSNQPQKARPAAPARDEDEAPRRRRPASDVDKFLEEVRRRRDAQEGRQRREEVVVARREPEPAKPAPPPLRERLKRPPVPPPLPEEVLIARPLPPPVRELEAMPPPPPPAVAAPRRVLASPAPTIIALLKQPANLAAAIVLQEILQPPLSRRRPGSRRR